MLRRKSELDNKLQKQKNIRKYFTNSNSSLFRKNFSSKCTKREWQYWWIPPCLDQVHFQKIFKKLKNIFGHIPDSAESSLVLSTAQESADFDNTFSF